MFRTIFYFVLALIPMTSISQTNKFKDLKKLILEGDSVFLLSHQVTDIVQVDDKTHQKKTLKLINNNKLDRSLIIEKVVINKKSDRDTVFKILTQPNTEKKIEMAKCFFPEHAIVIVNKKKYSFIELSFSCQRFSSSNDIDILQPDNARWSQLRDFFARMGIKHGIK